MQEDDIKNYLIAHPDFFEKNASLLADIRLPSPHGSGTISLAERQQLAQRDKINALEERFAEMILNAEENEVIAEKIHNINIDFHKAKTFDALEQLVSTELPEHFDLTDTCLRVWASPLDSSIQANMVFSSLPDEVKNWVIQRTGPYCGNPPEIVSEDWFLEAPASVAIIPLRQNDTIGFLALASDMPERFTSDMGTDFLSKIGEVISAALTRYLA